jgi:hypothetical protein
VRLDGRKSTRLSAPPRPSTKREKARPAERVSRAQSATARSAGRVMSSSWTTWVPGLTPFEMIAAVNVGDGVAAVLEHDPDARDAARLAGSPQPPSITRPMIVSAADAVAADADRGVGDIADIAAVVGAGAVERVARPRRRPHFERIVIRPAPGASGGRVKRGRSRPRDSTRWRRMAVDRTLPGAAAAAAESVGRRDRAGRQPCRVADPIRYWTSGRPFSASVARRLLGEQDRRRRRSSGMSIRPGPGSARTTVAVGGVDDRERRAVGTAQRRQSAPLRTEGAV